MLNRIAAALVVVVASSSLAQTLTRGPYLQLAAPTGVTVVFRTDRPGVGRVRYGVAGQALSQTAADTAAGTEHVVRLSGLTPATRYAYALELDSTPLLTSAPLRFRTHPLPGTVEAFRLFAWGDSGNGSSGQLRVAQRMATELNDAALSLILGDIIYPDGEPQNYDPNFFRPYAELASRMVIWPVIGNHDTHFDPLGGPWLDAFFTPANNPAATELYYSFDYANAHFVVLDTHVNSFTSTSAQMRWAQADLAASTATWKVVAFHVPPYTGGTHTDSAAVQAGILPIIEDAGVDLVFAGHSHVYERSYLLKANAIVQNDRSNYTKPTAKTGALYVVSGTAGQSGALANASHPLMAFQAGDIYGASVVDFTGNVAHGYFLKDDGSAIDVFRLSKGADTQGPVLVAARAVSSTQVEAVFNEPVQAGTGAGGAERTASWTISPATSVSLVQLGSDQRTVRLTTATHTPGAYTVSAAGIADRASPVNTTASTGANYVVSGDAGTFDAGALDAGRVDAGSSDAGSSDSGSVAPDAGVAGDAGLLFVGPLTPLRYLVGTSAAPTAWAGFAFDDSLWASGRQPIGYGEAGLGTTVVMGSAATLFTRAEFDLFVDPTAVQGLTLELDYDDGFVAYLNGTEVARRGIAANHTHQTLAVSHESGLAEVFALPNAQSLLRPGDNFLAIEVHNTSLTSSDLFLNARLWANAVIVQSDAGTRPSDDDAGSDAGESLADAGSDAGEPLADGGSIDGGASVSDAGTAPDGGSNGTDAGGAGEVTPPASSCSCQQPSGAAMVFLLALALARPFRRKPSAF